MSEIKHLKYIDGLKGMACLGVMLGHLSGILKYSGSYTGSVLITICRVLFKEGNWLVLFYVASGFLMSYTSQSVDSVGKAIKKLFFRLLRFILLFYIAFALVLIIQYTIGFWNHDLGIMLDNEWLRSTYTHRLSLKEYLIDPFRTMFLGDSLFIPQYYVLSDMYKGAVVVVIISLIYNKTGVLEKNIEGGGIAILFVVAAVFAITHNFIIFAHVLGMIAENFHRKKFYQSYGSGRSGIRFALILIVFVLTFFDMIAHNLAVLYALLLVLTDENRYARCIFENKGALFCGNISFGIYSMHWPIIASIGAFGYIRLYHSVFGVIINTAIIITIVFCVSLLFHKYLEKGTDWIINYLKNILN